MGILGFIVFAIVFISFMKGLDTDYRFNNRISPNGTDWKAMNDDLISGKSKTDVKIKFNNGGYDKK